MPTPAIKDKFFGLLLNSKMFEMLEAEEQKQLMHAYENAGDQQYMQGITEIERIEAELDQAAAEMAANEAHQVERALRIKKAYEELKKTKLRQMSEAEATNSEEAAEAMLSNIQTEVKPKKRKKFLGIF